MYCVDVGTSGNVTFDITPRRSRNHVVRITAEAADGRTLIVNRRFRLGKNYKMCTQLTIEITCRGLATHSVVCIHSVLMVLCTWGNYSHSMVI